MLGIDAKHFLFTPYFVQQINLQTVKQREFNNNTTSALVYIAQISRPALMMTPVRKRSMRQ